MAATAKWHNSQVRPGTPDGEQKNRGRNGTSGANRRQGGKGLRIRMGLLLILAITAGSAADVNAQAKGQHLKDYLIDFPEDAAPLLIGQRVAEHFVMTPHTNFNRTNPPKYITYPESCTWYGALDFAKVSGNEALQTALIKRFDPLLGEKAAMVPVPDHVDYAVFGIVPFELYLLTKDQKYLKLGKTAADTQWGAPQGKRATAASYYYHDQGLSWETRMWIDDMYMITALQTQAYRATGKTVYIDRAAKEMVHYLDSLQQPNGLFYHAPDVPFFWGRGNGWMAAGMTELLRSLPLNHADRPRILKGYHLMMASLLKHQAPTGMWRQLIDDPGSWEETSGTGMFTYAFITGVKLGWLDKETYGKAARKAWLALIKYIDANNDIHNVCEGTNKKNDRQYYLDRKRNTGDLHGQAPVLWCAAALLR